MGRLLSVYFEDITTNESFILYSITYNELGQIEQKKIYSNSENNVFLQKVDYTYTIKGQVEEINDVNSLNGDMFAMKFYYETSINEQNKTYKNGNISAIQWNSSSTNQVEAYMFEYDKMNRMTSAIYSPQERYNETAEYDLNGNITHLTRKGRTIKKNLFLIVILKCKVL